MTQATTQIQRPKRPTHSTCRRGHLLNKKNIYRRPDGYPACRTCAIAAVKRYLKRKKATLHKKKVA